MESVDSFIDQLLIEKGMTGIDQDIYNELKEDMKKRLLDQIDKAAVMQLSAEKADELTRKLEDSNFTNEDMVNFMAESGVDLVQVAANTMLQFREFYLASE